MEVGKSLYSYCGQRWSEESMSLCLSLSININIWLEHTAAPALTRGVIKHGTTSINFPKDVHNQILQLLHYSGIIWLSEAMLVSLDLITDVIWGQLGDGS